MSMLVPEDNHSTDERIEQARELYHPFQRSLELPLDMKDAAQKPAASPQEAERFRMQQMRALRKMDSAYSRMGKQIRRRLNKSVAVVFSSMNLGFFTALTFLLRWPDRLAVIDIVPKRIQGRRVR